jgi:ABC-type transport system involved in Fe-S cluster assembly fused permease/ATPase subunit
MKKYFITFMCSILPILAYADGMDELAKAFEIIFVFFTITFSIGIIATIIYLKKGHNWAFVISLIFSILPYILSHIVFSRFARKSLF